MFRDGRAVTMGVRTVTSSLALMTAWPYYLLVGLMKVQPCYDKIPEHNDNIARYDDNNTFFSAANSIMYTCTGRKGCKFNGIVIGN